MRLVLNEASYFILQGHKQIHVLMISILYNLTTRCNPNAPNEGVWGHALFVFTQYKYVCILIVRFYQLIFFIKKVNTHKI
jgi:hypothetical protein